MADESSFYGTWKIVECVSLAGTTESTGIEGTEFTLYEGGDVSWKVAEDAEQMPFFACETYEVCFGEQNALKFFESFASHVIRFKVDMTENLMLLTYDMCCMLQCQKISSNDTKDENPFSLLRALEEGYFSDLTIKAANGKEFMVHKSVLELVGGDMDWQHKPPPLSGLPEPVLHAVLHFLYAECLPHDLDEDTAKQCIKVTSKMPGFSRFTQLCDTFLKNTALKQQIIGLVTEMHSCCDKIIDLFNGKGVSAEGYAYRDESIMTNPAKLSYVIVQSLRELAVAGAKAFILCDLFTKRKGKLSKEERHEIIKYAKSRLPVFMNQLCRFLEVCKQHSTSLTAAQRREIATYMVPEILSAFETMSSFVTDTKYALEQVINSSNSPDKAESKADHKPDKHKKGHVGGVLGKSLRNALHMKELMKLKNFHEKTTQNFVDLMQKKESFYLLSREDKIRTVSKGLDQLIDDIPGFQMRIEELMTASEEKTTWRDWKYLFKLGTSKVAWMLGKLQNHRPMLQTMINQICDMVHKDQFNQCMVSLALRDPPESSATPNDTATGGAIAPPPPAPGRYAQLSCVESLCKSPYASESLLARNAFSLLKREEATDMVFEVISVQEGGDMVIDHTHGGEPMTRLDHSKEVDITLVKAHRVIIAARCDWFRRALLSGMRESIDKKITVHDTQPHLFRIFLEYLYGGQLDSSGLTIDQLADLMALADRYEMDSLKVVCEHTLLLQLDEDSALFLLSLADQFNCRILKSATLTFVGNHQQVKESDVFEELPEHLQTLVEDTIKCQPNSRGDMRGCLSGYSHTETPSSLSSVSEMDELMCALDLGDRMDIHASSSSSSEELHFLEDPARLENCLSELRDILGDLPRDELTRIALAADYDINRAVNFYFPS